MVHPQRARLCSDTTCRSGGALFFGRITLGLRKFGRADAILFFKLHHRSKTKQNRTKKFRARVSDCEFKPIRGPLPKPLRQHHLLMLNGSGVAVNKQVTCALPTTKSTAYVRPIWLQPQRQTQHGGCVYWGSTVTCHAQSPDRYCSPPCVNAIQLGAVCACHYCEDMAGKEIILRSNSPWGHHHIYTLPDISVRPAWWLDWLDPV